MVNQERLLQVLAAVELDEAHWDPRYWAFQPDGNECGTTYCTAGHTVKLVHPDAVFEFDGVVHLGRVPRGADANEKVLGQQTNSVLLPNGKWRHIKVLAQELLGLTDEQADRLFYYGVRVHDLDEHGDWERTRNWDPETDGVPSVDGLRELIKGIIDEDQEA